MENFQTISLSKSGRLRPREVVAYRRWSLMVDCNYSQSTRKILVFWKSGRLRKVVARGSSTVSCPSLLDKFTNREQSFLGLTFFTFESFNSRV